jgi:hypothetical protein
VLYKFSTLFCLIALVGCVTSRNAVDLKFNLAQGKSYAYTFDYAITQQADGQTIKSNFTAAYTLDVLDVQNGNRVMKATYDRVYMKVEAPQQTIEIDTDNPPPTRDDLASDPTKMFALAFHGMVGKSITITANAKGEVLKVEGFDALMNSMADSMMLDDETRMAMQQVLEQQFNDAAVKRMFEQSINIFPNEKVKVGDSWNKDLETPASLLGGIKMTNTYTVKEIEGNTALLDLSSDINTGSGDLVGMQSGTLAVDIPTGLVVNARITQRFKSRTKDKPMDLVSEGTVTAIER